MFFFISFICLFTYIQDERCLNCDFLTKIPLFLHSSQDLVNNFNNVYLIIIVLLPALSWVFNFHWLSDFKASEHANTRDRNIPIRRTKNGANTTIIWCLSPFLSFWQTCSSFGGTPEQYGRNQPSKIVHIYTLLQWK